MKLRPVLLFLLAIAGLIGCNGCESKKPSDSKIPWARPASWEGGPPGMGGIQPPR